MWKQISAILNSTGSKRVFDSRNMPRLLTLIAVLITVYHLYMLSLGVIEIRSHRAIHLTSLMLLAFLSYSFSSKKVSKKIPLVDWGLALLSMAIMVYIMLNVDRFENRAPLASPVSPADLFFGLALILLIFEAGRRVMGTPLVITTLVFLGYYLLGEYLPGMWSHAGSNIPKMVDGMYMTIEGIWSAPIAVSSTFVFVFIVFGELLMVSGGGQFFSNLAMASFGRSKGGSAKSAIVASALFGTISGSGPANVAATGSFTIPMMKLTGYEPYFAGAVEATASTGGLITPPVMAGTLFLMSQLTGIPYSTIALACAIPALLYYLALFVQVHMHAAKAGIVGVTGEVPPIGKVLLDGGHYFLPVIVIGGALAIGITPIRAALYAMGVIVIISFRNRKTIITPRKIFNAFDKSAKSACIMAVGSACAGMMMGVVFQTGLGYKFPSMVAAISGNSLIFALIMAMAGCLLLGFALSISASYILTVLLIVPAAVGFGVPIMAAHLFCVFYAVLSIITPPVGGTMFIAAAMAGADPMKLGWAATRLAVGGFIIPFFFVYRPALLFVGTPAEIAVAVVTSIIGVACIAAAVEGYIKGRMALWERVLAVAAGVAMIFPEWGLNLGGLVIGFIAVFLHIRRNTARANPSAITTN